MRAATYQYERVASTMDLIHELAQRGADAGSMVIAAEQLQGRGSRGRPWHSPPGGLWLSALYRPPSTGGSELLSVRVGLAVARALDPHVPTPVSLKWPNDLMVDGRKLGGILCEARWQGGALGWIAAGVGLNVRNPVPGELRETAVSLIELDHDIRLENVFHSVSAALHALDLVPKRLSPAELELFAGRSWLDGREIREPVTGIVAGLNEDGALRVRTPQGSHVSLRYGSVELADVSPAR